MNRLAAGQFAEFFEAVYGYGPFPWQARVAGRGRWISSRPLP